MPRVRSADGFTLPEVLVVIFVIAILATIAVPTFLGHTDRGRDAAAKSNSASLASMIEQCNVEHNDFRRCDTQDELAGDTASVGLPIGPDPGSVEIAQANANVYRLLARSESGVTYHVMRIGSGRQQRTCAPHNTAGCPTNGNW